MVWLRSMPRCVFCVSILHGHCWLRVEFLPSNFKNISTGLERGLMRFMMFHLLKLSHWPPNPPISEGTGHRRQVSKHANIIQLLAALSSS